MSDLREVYVVGVGMTPFARHLDRTHNDLTRESVQKAMADAEGLIAFLKDRLGSVKTPKGIDFIDQLPRTGAVKISKKDLRARYWEGVGRKIRADSAELHGCSDLSAVISNLGPGFG